MKTALLVLGGFAAGLVGGVLIGARWTGSPEAPAPPAGFPAPGPVPGVIPGAIPEAPLPPVPAAEGTGAAALPPEVRDRIRERAEKIRANALRLHDQAEAEATDRVLREIREEEARRAREEALRAALANGEAWAVLADEKKRGAHPFDLLADRESLDRCFARIPAGTVLDPGSLDPRVPLPEAPAFVFAAGRHEFAASRLRSPFTSLSITGHGMDRTLIVFDDRLTPTAEFATILLRDATIFADSRIVDVRQAAAVRIERCRLIGFDRGAGGSDAIGGGDVLIDAVDSRFELGFGDSPDHGRLLDVRGLLLARFERCAFAGPLGGFVPRGSGDTCSYASCRFTDLDPRARSSVESPPAQVRFADCSCEYLPDAFERPRKSRPLSDLEPSFAPPDPRRDRR